MGRFGMPGHRRNPVFGLSPRSRFRALGPRRVVGNGAGLGESVATLPDLGAVRKIPSSGAHGLDIDHSRGRLYVACDDSTLVEMSSTSGDVTNVWPIAGPPDVTFFNPATGLVHVAIEEPGLVETIDPRNGHGTQTVTGADAHTTALVAPDRLYVISPTHGGILVLSDA
jgi:hypothetical protein